ncbi:acetylglutamate kinase [Acidaminococcus sp. CAG:917]|nr:acetylglutamate kinase [Acidaminococcus sp. CAG:917]
MIKNIGNAEKAEILMQALPYIKKYHKQTVVIKYGGNAMTDDNIKKMVMGDLVLLRQIGVNVVLVHGGGPEINDALKKMNIETEFIGGLRKTGEDAISVVQMVLAGKVNKDLVNLIELCGGQAVGLCGIDGRMIEADFENKELGFVGKITNVNPKPVLDMLEAGFIPVVASVGCDKKGNVYNINADTVAARLAAELKAMSLINLSDVPGLLKDKNDPTTLIKEVNVSETLKLMNEGIISGGMIPKVKCCVEAIRRGVKQVFIIDGTVEHAILVEMMNDEGVGTMFH